MKTPDLKFNKNCIKGFESTDMGEYGELMFDECVKRNAKNILEIGVANGVSTRILLEACKQTGGRLTSVDVNAKCKLAVKDPNWTFIHENSAFVLYDEAVDVLVIDSSHYYTETLVELTRFMMLVNPGGIVFLHDFGLTGVYRAVVEYMIKFNEWSLRMVNTNTKTPHQALGVMERR